MYRNQQAGTHAGPVQYARTTKRHRLEENIGAAAVELTPDDLRDFESAASKITIQGARYPEHIEQMSNR